MSNLATRISIALLSKGDYVDLIGCISALDVRASPLPPPFPCSELMVFSYAVPNIPSDP